ncbi:hypothetical protein NPIL_981 [Nephila pilipes]|uniref:Uncharacterized protein n=1 Tax=Nephila pilipes TaxID=299642 RepID=A0A8X6TLW9_NEPPI|nr:hypothetical protein NPIL_981 [Nephila pilipes]
MDEIFPVINFLHGSSLSPEQYFHHEHSLHAQWVLRPDILRPCHKLNTLPFKDLRFFSSQISEHTVIHEQEEQNNSFTNKMYLS